MGENTERLNALFARLVPVKGKADTVAGEIVRALSRIEYRYFNDGDRLGVGYGNETCNAPGRYLMKNTDALVRGRVEALWGVRSYSVYETKLHELVGCVLVFLAANPQLETTSNTEDMWSYMADEDRWHEFDPENWDDVEEDL